LSIKVKNCELEIDKSNDNLVMNKFLTYINSVKTLTVNISIVRYEDYTSIKNKLYIKLEMRVSKNRENYDEFFYLNE